MWKRTNNIYTLGIPLVDCTITKVADHDRVNYVARIEDDKEGFRYLTEAVLWCEETVAEIAAGILRALGKAEYIFDCEGMP